MKIFISHQKQDLEISQRIGQRLKERHGIECYLDAIDPYMGGPVELLGDHIRREMAKCTQLLAVVSVATAKSEWVPWEIGVATEKDFPLATFSAQGTIPPEFLRRWPYLRTDGELDQYATISKAQDRVRVQKSVPLNENAARATTTRDFYRALKAALGQ